MFGRYRVRLGDTPQTIAQHVLGDASRWPEIVAVNPTKPRVHADGVTTFASLSQGEVLNVPNNSSVQHAVVDTPVGVGQPPSQGDAQATVQAAYGQMSPDTQQLIQNTLGQYFGQDSVNSAVSAYSQFGPSAINAVTDISKGNVVGAIGAATPLIAAGLAASGVGAPVAAAVLAILPIVEGVAADLFGGPKVPVIVSCNWTVPQPVPWDGKIFATCFNGQRPYNYKDPKWLTIEQFAKGSGSTSTTWVAVDANTHELQPDPTSGGVFTIETWPSVTFPVSWPALQSDLTSIGVSMPGMVLDAQSHQPINGPGIAQLFNSNNYSGNVHPIVPFGNAGSAPDTYNQNLLNFVSTLDQAVIRSLEYPINDWPTADPLGLLMGVVKAWNAKYSSAATYTFDGSGKTFVDMLINGGAIDIDNLAHGTSTGQSWPPVTVNIGDEYDLSSSLAALVGMINPNSAAAGSSSTGTKVAVGTAAVVGTGALAAFVYAQLAGMAFTSVLSHAWKKSKTWVQSKTGHGSKRRRRAHEAYAGYISNPLALPEYTGQLDNTSTAIQAYYKPKRIRTEPKRRVAFRVNLDHGPDYEAIVLAPDNTAILYRYGRAVVRFRPAKYQFTKIRQQHGELLIYADQVVKSLLG